LKQKTESIKSILILTIILILTLLLRCGGEFPTENGEAPKVRWVYASGQLLVHYRYDGGCLTGYTAYARFKNEGGGREDRGKSVDHGKVGG